MALLVIFAAVCSLLPLCFGQFISESEVTVEDAVYNRTSRGTSKHWVGPVLKCAVNHNLTYEVKFSWQPVGRALDEDTKYETVVETSPPSSSAKFTKVGTHAAGIWTCTISDSEGKQSVSKSVTLFSYPQIKSLPRSVNLVEGNTLEQNCEAWGYPPPTISWRRGTVNSSVEFDPTDSRISYTNDNTSDLVNLKLHFTQLKIEDRDNYVCIATNSIGGEIHEEAYHTLVRVKSHLAPLWPFLGILAEIILLAVIIGGYELYRRKQKSESDDKDTPQNQHAEDARKKN